MSYLTTAASITGALLVIAVISLFRELLHPSLQLLLFAGIGLGLSVAGGLVLGLLAELCSLICAPLTRRSQRKALAKQVAALGLDQLDEEIEVVRRNVQAFRHTRRAAALEAWLQWLERQRAARPRPSESNAAARSIHWTVKPALSPQLLMACIGLPFLGLGLFAGFDTVRTHTFNLLTIAAAIGVSGLGLFVLGIVSTVRIELTPDRLRLRRFGLIRWSISADRVELLYGNIGDGSVIAGYRVLDKVSGTKIGEIVSAQFREADLDKLAAMFPPRPPAVGDS